MSVPEIKKNYSFKETKYIKKKPEFYNKWYIPASNRFFQKVGSKVFEVESSPLMNNGIIKIYQNYIF